MLELIPNNSSTAMLWRKAAHLASIIALTFQQTSAKLITITQYPTSCKAIYTSGSRSVTIIQSTTVVTPEPWTDSDANGGEPFVLEVQSSGGPQRRAADDTMLVRPDGTLTTYMDAAAQYMIDEDGKLTSVDGGYISAEDTARHQIFALSPTLGSISTEFTVKDGVLTWTNSDFSNGAAQFYEIGVEGSENANRVLVRFSDRINSDWKPILLLARPANEGSQSGSTSTEESSTATSTATSHIGEGDSSGDHTRHTRTRSRTATRSLATGTLSVSSSPLASGSVSPDGTCSGDVGYTCLGSGFGDCCSRRGECGSGKRYCNNGCQPLYGICMSVASASLNLPLSLPSSSVAPWPSTISVSILFGSTVSGSVSIPISTFTSPAGPIGPIDISIFTSRPTTASGLSGQTSNPAGAPASSTTPSTPPVAACPTSTADLCGSSDNSATCSSPGGTPYNNTCGVIYLGPVIDTSSINGLPPIRGVAYQGSVIDTGDIVGLRKRATEASLADCQTLCDRYMSCVVFDYVGTNCTLLSGIEGTQYVVGAVGGAVPQEYIAAKTNPPSASAQASVAAGNPAAGSSPAIMQPSSSNVMVMQTSQQVPIMQSSAGPEAAMSSSNPAMVVSSAASQAMPMSTIAEILTSTTAPAAPPTESSPNSEAVSRPPESTTEQALVISNPLSIVVPPTAASSSAPSTATGASMCPDANGTDYSDSTGNVYVVLCDVEFTPAAVDLSTQETFEACVDSCASLTSLICAGVTFVQDASGSGSGTCSYYTEYTDSSPQPGVSGAVLASVLASSETPPNPSSSEAPPESSTAASSTVNNPELPSSAPPTSSPAIANAPSPSPSAVASSSSTSSTPTRTYYLVLDSPTPCDFGDYANDGTPLDEDDSLCVVQLPFAMRMYSARDTWTYASTNGYISLESGSSQYSNQPFPASNIPANAVAPFFDDLYLVGDSKPQTGIFYEISDTAVTYEYYLNRGGNNGVVDTSEVFHFTVAYDSTQPGIFTYTYYEMGDNGQYAAVGMQGSKF